MGKKLIYVVDDRELGPNSLMEPQFIYSVYLFSACYMPGTLTGSSYTVVNKTNPCFSWSFGGELRFRVDICMCVCVYTHTHI